MGLIGGEVVLNELVVQYRLTKRRATGRNPEARSRKQYQYSREDTRGELGTQARGDPTNRHKHQPQFFSWHNLSWKYEHFNILS